MNNIEVFKGEFADDERNGLGEYKWPDNKGLYTGPYVDGVRQTEEGGPDGTMTWNYADKTHTFAGRWEEGDCTVGLLDGNQVDARKM